MTVSLRSTSDAFTDAYGRPPAGLWAAPGRVNLIGEHTDYNDGFVLPLALPHRVVCAAAPRGDDLASVRSRQAPGGTVTAKVSELYPGRFAGWAAYPLGVLWAMRAAGHHVGGVDLLVDGDVPLGAGLSSSAALECAVALALDDLGGLRLERTALAALARRAENDFVGAPTGVMDQMVSLHAQANHLLFLDTRTMHVEHVPLDLDAHRLALLVVDTRAPHRLIDGEYARRRRDCEQAASLLGVVALRDVGIEAFDDDLFLRLPSELQRRARHVITENARVQAVVRALRRGDDPRKIGAVLTASHESLRDDFEVTVPQLDLAVTAALAAGAHGARMTGGGFGGCVIALVDDRQAHAVGHAVGSAFTRQGFDAPRTFLAHPSVGALRTEDINRDLRERVEP